ncbi:ribokinase [Pseudomarimonas salicorniae]|uniref:Ribokinase n=1 Tax=Pseudomarimonas salicorniae TaxID=2933270 RepID=A0ABT0GCA7_9GAMM|nr:ribokinase [Lysobacter sp. CAU 1642]MCK7592173.1 ribokinase [Lysobacter sp. CAU 1642]
MAARKKKSAACDVVVVGSYNQDMVWQAARLPAPGETRMGRFSSGPGGKGFNQAVAAARQGARTAFIAARGNDALGERAADTARAEGIDARWQQVAGEATGTAAIWLDAAGQNSIVVAPGANSLLAPAHVLAQRETIASARVLLTQHEVHPVASLRALQLAGELGLLRIHNPAPQQDGAAYRALLAECELLTPNESEFAALVRAHGAEVEASAIASLADEDLHTLCRLLPVPSVVLTLGAAGAFVSHADPTRFHDVAAAYRVPGQSAHVVDTTGAGDCFNGALAASLACAVDLALATHVAQATRCAACSVESHGAAASMPTREQVGRRFPG